MPTTKSNQSLKSAANIATIAAVLALISGLSVATSLGQPSLYVTTLLCFVDSVVNCDAFRPRR